VLDAAAWLVSRRRGARERDPAAARALLDALGIPDPPAVVHVVGTNGKGSVTHALAAMAQAAGHRSGRFTSPHVETLGERVAVDGRALDLAALTAFVERVRPLAEAGALPDVGFFEWTLALALERFAAEGVTLAVIEAGVGARHDATSAVRNVVASVITNVTLDHVETLGPTLEAIARDKAAAARPGVPLVSAASGAPLAVIARAARAAGSPFLALAGGDGRFALPAGVDASFWPATHVQNLRLACATARVLAFDEGAIAAGCAAPRPPARFEVFELGDRRVVLDGAHDPAAASALAAAVAPPYVLLFGALARKQGAATFAPLAERAIWSIVTSADADESAGPWPASARHDDPGAALALALERAGPGGTVVVAGSLYLAGRLRPELRRRAATAGTGVVATG
jgi:dihydrofolate synthase / folylpolyglutamate synthase